MKHILLGTTGLAASVPTLGHAAFDIFSEGESTDRDDAFEIRIGTTLTF